MLQLLQLPSCCWAYNVHEISLLYERALTEGPLTVFLNIPKTVICLTNIVSFWVGFREYSGIYIFQVFMKYSKVF